MTINDCTHSAVTKLTSKKGNMYLYIVYCLCYNPSFSKMLFCCFLFLLPRKEKQGDSEAMTRFQADTSSANSDSAPFLLFILNHAAEESCRTLIHSIWSQLK